LASGKLCTNLVEAVKAWGLVYVPGIAGKSHVALEIEPELFMVGGKLTQAFSNHIKPTGLFLKRCVDLK
jgi:hypothetical protein